MKRHSYAWPFQEPVDREEVHDYYEVIQNPIDLSTIEKKLNNDFYKSRQMFLADLELMFENCRSYNGSDTPYYKCANSLEQFVNNYVKQSWKIKEKNKK